MTNPYESSRSVTASAPDAYRNRRTTSYVLAVFAIVIGAIHLRPFLVSPMAMWGWQNWWFGFAPAAYLVVAAVISVVVEHCAIRVGLISLPLFLLPLLLVTGLILFVTYLDLPNILARKYAFSQDAYTLLILSLCPVVWYYLAVSSARSIRLLRVATGG